MGQSSSDRHRPSPGRHRPSLGRHRPSLGRHRQERLHRHRAPAFPALFATRGRTALSVTALSATLAAGVGVAGVSASASTGALVSNPSAHVTASHPYAELPVVAPPGDEAPGKQFPRGSLAADPPALAAEPTGHAVQRKKRPAVVTKAAVATTTAVAARAWVHPMPAAGVTSCFGQRWGRLHAGVDLAAAHGTPVVAAGAGVVVAAGEEGGYGNAVLIRHDNGYLTHYGHLSAILVVPGQQVTAGERIGLEGSTGHSTGPHLHFEVHQGHYKNPIEPTAWMRAHGVELGGCA
ncbi:M23 family metallopeptidase [Actinoplanes sp. NPDC023714]|uniref:M23 family metallopeptidase n=1 Tax=Actinoplanes sp. NPDC023714 TaxID=3154322 RepID=UPI00341023F3